MGPSGFGLSYFAIQMLYKPKDEKKMDPQFIHQEIAKLGPMKAKEKIVAAILAVSLCMWITERVHSDFFNGRPCRATIKSLPT
jgi:di/tricarboxylate transporter